jgi:cell division protein FtsL
MSLIEKIDQNKTPLKLNKRSQELYDSLTMSEVRLQRIMDNRASTDSQQALQQKQITKEQKRALSIEKKALAEAKRAAKLAQKLTKSKSRSRSSSRSRLPQTTTAKTTTLGAKVYIKKDMQKTTAASVEISPPPPPPLPAAVQALLPAKRNLRSSSSTSSTGGDSSVATSTTSSSGSSDVQIMPFLLSTTPRYVKSIKPEIELIVTSTPSYEDTDDEVAYNLRNRRITTSIEKSPVREIAETKLGAHPVHRTAAAALETPAPTLPTLFNKVHTSGYLRFSLKQFLSLVLASLLLLAALSVINYFQVFRGKSNLIFESLQVYLDSGRKFFYDKVCVNSKLAYD